MRWLWRFILLVLVLALWQGMENNPEGQAVSGYVTQKVKVEVRYWQRQIQDFPANIEAEIRRLLGEFKSSGDGEVV